ncbi:MAG: histidine kinase, partial [Gloeobacteraceae cyanobacterium ES-bin-316]|nr:histidine kinase [Ferruginibacter sp.]
NGLSNNKVNCILQDKRGFTWIGTDDGLNRYDGNNFIIFKNNPSESSSISGNSITDLHEDKEGLLWIATADGGISKYDYRQPPAKQFTQFKHHPGNTSSIPINIVNDLQEDKAGNLWLATSGAGVLKFDKNKASFIKPAGMGQWTIYDMSFDENGILWAGREGGSILKVNPKNLEWQADQRYLNVYAALPHVVVTSLFKDSKNNMWFGSWDKAVYRYTAAGVEESFRAQKDNFFSFGNDEAIAFNEDRQGRIWIGGKTNGLYLYEPRSQHFYNYRYDPAKEGTLSSNKVNCIFIDRAGLVWLGTDNGISICQETKQQFVQEFLPSQKEDGKPLVIYDFLKNTDGSLWIGTNEGLYIKNKNAAYTFKKILYMGNALSITKFYKDETGTIFIGTDFSVFELNPATFQVSVLPNTEKDMVMAKLIESRIVSIVKDTLEKHPVLWTAPYGHFFSYYDFSEQHWISRTDTVKRILRRYDISDNLIRKIVKLQDKSIWLANAKKGLIQLNKNSTGHTDYINDPGSKTSISNNNVYDIKEDGLGNLWVSTYGGGLNYFERQSKQFKHFYSDNNLLEGLETDEKQNVWSVTNGNLLRFDTHAQTFSYMPLPDLEKTGGVKGYIYKDAEGKMYVAGQGYYFSFDPGKVTIEQKQPEVFLTDFSIFNNSFSHLLMQEEIALGHTQNFFTLHFAAPYYDASAPVQYSYMLQGVDESWINAGASTQAPYTNLGGGEYVFKVRATATPGSWSEKITTIRIRIIPPFWKRWWFFAALGLAFTGIGYGLYRYRINELLKRQAIRNKIAQDLHDSVGSTLSSISVYSQVAKIYNEQEKSADLKSTLEKIGIASSEMISEMSDTVWAINPRNDDMETILQRMESFARPLLLSQEILFHFNYDEAVQHVILEMTKRKNFYLIFKEAINNALKYAACKNLWVDIKYRQHQLFLTIKDDGIGFNTGTAKASLALSGNGLQNFQRRAKEMKGSCIIESEIGQGTKIILQFPIP